MVMGGFFLGNGESGAQGTVASTRQVYTEEMNAYKKEKGQFDRDKTLYYRNQDEQHFATALSSAQKTFGARQKVMVSYSDYLAALVDTYVSKESLVAEGLKTKLTEGARSFQSASNNFTDTVTWNQADDNFARAMVGANETFYQAFVQIYYHELKAIYEEYKTIYQKQNQRILGEAVNSVEREEKNKVLEQTARALATLQDKITAFEPQLGGINSQDSYFAMRNQLNEVMAELESSLKLYADLE
jgi:hypothetical protein